MYIYLIFPLFFTILFVGGCFYFQKEPKNPLISKNLSTLQEDYAREAQRVMAAIRAEFAIPQGIWDRYMGDFEYYKNKDMLFCKKPLKKTKKDLVSSLLQEHGIDIKQVHVKEIGGNGRAEAFQDLEGDHIIHRLSINFDWLNTRPKSEQKAVICHEIQHLLNYDPIEEMYIRWILIDMGYTEEDWKNTKSMTDYYHLRELRADAFACAKSKSMAQSMHDFFCDTACLTELEEEWYTHPRDTVRAQQLAFLHNLDSKYSNLV